MAKQSSINKNNRRLDKGLRYRLTREELRRKAVNPHVSEADRYEARVKLMKLPRDTAITRVVNRCHLTGRPRGFLRKFGLSRIAMRELALSGKLPGVTKASW